MSAYVLFAFLAGTALAADTPKFEVVSIKPCKDGDVAPGRGGKGGGGGAIRVSPDRLTAECVTLRALIRSAYIQFAGGTHAPFVSPRVMQQDIKGSPSWIDTARFDIQAKAETPQRVEMLRGPMLQALLEERFHLRLHRDTKEEPIYELRMARGGPKFQAASPGGCVPRESAPPLEPEPGKAPPRVCGMFSGSYMYGATMEDFCRQLTAILDRDVVDKTGLSGAFDLHFAWTADDFAPAPGGPAEPPPMSRLLETTVPKLGLRLESAKGRMEVLVMDGVERPSGN